MATIIQSLSFEELADASDFVVSGRVIRSWAAWDASHKYIWTHYELAVTSAHKGAPGSLIEIAEPGGALEGHVMTIAGSVIYQAGDNVVVFLARMPNGYLRTTGWAQGKYGLDANNRLHASVSSGADVVSVGTPPAASSSLKTLEGMSVNELRVRIAARVRLAQAPGRTQ